MVSYANAFTMAGIHGGVQARFKDANKKALFNGCGSHSLNLCGQHSFAENASCVSFFGTLQALFSLFAASTHRWEVLINNTEVSVKRLAETLWSAHYEPVKPVSEKLDQFVDSIEALCDQREHLDTRGKAQGLLLAVCDFTLLIFWGDVLGEVDLAQQYL